MVWNHSRKDGPKTPFNITDCGCSVKSNSSLNLVNPNIGIVSLILSRIVIGWLVRNYATPSLGKTCYSQSHFAVDTFLELKRFVKYFLISGIFWVSWAWGSTRSHNLLWPIVLRCQTYRLSSSGKTKKNFEFSFFKFN